MKKGLLFIFLVVHLLWFLFGKNIYGNSIYSEKNLSSNEDGKNNISSEFIEL